MAFIALTAAAVAAAASPAPAPRRAPAAVAAPAAPKGNPAAPTVAVLSPAYYDTRYKVIVVPYAGPVPTYTQGSVDNPPRTFLDFQARFRGGIPTGTVPDHPNLLKWVMAPRGAGVTRLTLTFRQGTKVRVLHNARRHLLVLIPQPVPGPKGASPAPSASPSPSPSPSPTVAPTGATTLGAPHYDAARRALVVPYTGALPASITETLNNPPRVYFDFEASYLRRTMPAAYVTGHPTLVRWALSPRDRSTTRVTLTFTQPVRVRLKPDELRHELLLIPESAPAMASPAPSPTPTVTSTLPPRRSPAPSTKPAAAPTLEPPRMPSEKPTPLDSP
jgi:hypothetical protein